MNPKAIRISAGLFLALALAPAAAVAQQPVVQDPNAPAESQPRTYKIQAYEDPNAQYQQPQTNQQYQQPQYQQPQYQQPQYQQPQYQQPQYQQPQYQQPVAAPPPAAAAPAQPPPSSAKSFVDQLQADLIFHAKRATIMSLPALGVLAAGLFVGSIMGAVAASAVVGSGIALGVFNAAYAPVWVLLILPALPAGGIIIGALTYVVARVISVTLTSMFYEVQGLDFDQRLRNARINIVSDFFGHIGAGLGVLSGLGLATLGAAFLSSVIGLGSLIVMAQVNQGELNPAKWDLGPAVALGPSLFLVGVAALGVGAFGLVASVVASHVAFPLATVITRPLVFGDAAESRPVPVEEPTTPAAPAR